MASVLAVSSAGLLGEPIYGNGLGVAYSAAPAVSKVYNSYGLASIDDQLSVGVSNQNIVRSYGGTVSQISKKVVSPTSVVSKFDTRINNAGIKTLAYAQPQIISQPSYGYAAPIAQKIIAQPAVSYVQPAISYAQPSISYAQPAVGYAQPALSAGPLAYGSQTLVKASYASPIVNYAW